MGFTDGSSPELPTQVPYLIVIFFCFSLTGIRIKVRELVQPVFFYIKGNLLFTKFLIIPIRILNATFLFINNNDIWCSNNEVIGNVKKNFAVSILFYFHM